MKHCKRCDETKPLSDFYEHRTGRTRDGLLSWCKRCLIAAALAWNREHPDRHREQNRRSMARRAARARAAIAIDGDG